jgi:hypothetical protein
MYAGLVGRVVEAYAPHTEASATSIAAHFITALGNAVGPSPYFTVGETIHRMNEFLLIVGKSSRARKGDAKNIALRPLQAADPEWAANVAGGLSSSEGLLYHVRDRIEKPNAEGELVVVDEGAQDKRALLIETEFVNVLKQFERTGNTLSALLRDAWDGKDVLRSLTKNQPLKATHALISLIAHTTAEDLHTYLSSTDAANGFGNRFLMIETDRVRSLPNPERIPSTVFNALLAQVRTTLEFARTVTEMRRTQQAARLWEDTYPKLTEDHPGLLGSLLARSEAHVARLSSLYSLLSRSSEIDVEHIESALAFWDVCETSVRRIFADRTGNVIADNIKEGLLPGQEVTLTELRGSIVPKNIAAGRLRDAVELLVRLGEVKVEKRVTEGRSANVLRRIVPEETRAGNGGFRLAEAVIK